MTSDIAKDKARFKLAREDKVVGFIGQFIDRKNPLVLVRALARVRSVPKLKCLFVGSGPLEGALRTEIDRLGMSTVCRIVEFQDDITPILRAIDVLALPSLQESFGLVLVEAASYGKPAIAFSSEGPDEIIVHGRTGLLIAQGDELQLAKAIEQVFLKPSDRIEMGKAAEQRAAELFSPATNTQTLEHLLLSVINGNRECELSPQISTGTSLAHTEQSLISEAGT